MRIVKQDNDRIEALVAGTGVEHRVRCRPGSLHLPLVRQVPGKLEDRASMCLRSISSPKRTPRATQNEPGTIGGDLKKGDTKACMEFFARLSEKERQGYAEHVRTWFKSLSKNAFLQTKPSTFERNPLMEAAAVAVQAACSLSDLKQFSWRALPGIVLHFAIFTARRPAWFDDWVSWLCEAAPHRWPLVRRFVCQGLCRAPDTDHYALGMIVGVCAYHDNKNTIYSALLEDPELLQNDIWRLFEVEGDKEFCLAARDKYSRADNRWTYALVRLAQENKLSRPPA